MSSDRIGFLDRCIAELDTALRVSYAQARTSAPNPADDTPPADAKLSLTERDFSARLMRVNHSGEVAAQALYRGQSLVTGDLALGQQLLKAADEEHAARLIDRFDDFDGKVHVSSRGRGFKLRRGPPDGPP